MCTLNTELCTYKINVVIGNNAITQKLQKLLLLQSLYTPRNTMAGVAV